MSAKLSQFRPVCDHDGKFLPWVKALCGRSGAYVIRCSWMLRSRVVYVGESHTRNLSKTLKRHFFPWSDDPIRKHHVYNRHRVEVAVHVVSPRFAVRIQNGLIRRLEPRDNLAIPTGEEHPF